MDKTIFMTLIKHIGTIKVTIFLKQSLCLTWVRLLQTKSIISLAMLQEKQCLKSDVATVNL